MPPNADRVILGYRRSVRERRIRRVLYLLRVALSTGGQILMPQGHYNPADKCYYCDECQDQGTQGSIFDTLEALRQHGKITHNWKRVTVLDADKDPRNRPPRSPGTYTADEVLNLPNWDRNGTIHNRLRVIKEVEGNRRIFTLKVTANSTMLNAEVLSHPCNLPPNTTMSEHVLTTDAPEDAFPSIYAELKARQGDFVYFQNPIEYDIIALGTAASFFPEIFRALPFFGFTSTGRGWGKSTATKVMVYGGYSGIWMADPSKAAFFRLINDAGGIVGFDQIDDILSDAKRRSDLLAVVDSAHQKGIHIPRVDVDTGIIDYFDPFCIVVWNGTEAIPDSLMSRTLITPMMECRGQKKLQQLPIADDFREVRDRLYVWRLRNHEQVQHIYEQLSTHKSIPLTDRYRDLFLPLLVVAHLVDEPLYQHILEYAEEFVKDRAITQHDAWTQTLVQILPDYTGEVQVVDIREKLNAVLMESGELSTRRDGSQWVISSQWIKKRLNALGFKRSPKRAQGRLHYFIEEERVQHLQVVFGLVTPDISVETHQTHQTHRPETTNIPSRPDTPTEPENANSTIPLNSGEVSEVSEFPRTHIEHTKQTPNSTAQPTPKDVPNSAPDTPENTTKPPEPLPPVVQEIMELGPEPVQTVPGITEEERQETGKETPPKPSPEQQERLKIILEHIRKLSSTHTQNIAEVIFLHQECKQYKWPRYHIENLYTDLQHLKDAGLIMETRPGAIKLVKNH